MTRGSDEDVIRCAAVRVNDYVCNFPQRPHLQFRFVLPHDPVCGKFSFVGSHSFLEPQLKFIPRCCEVYVGHDGPKGGSQFFDLLFGSRRVEDHRLTSQRWKVLRQFLHYPLSTGPYVEPVAHRLQVFPTWSPFSTETALQPVLRPQDFEPKPLGQSLREGRLARGNL